MIFIGLADQPAELPRAARKVGQRGCNHRLPARRACGPRGPPQSH